MLNETASNGLPFWIATAGIAAPLIALAGSAVAFVIKVYNDGERLKRDQFFELMQFIDGDRPIATKLAAVYQLRSYPEHREFIVRFCDRRDELVIGVTGESLRAEMQATADAMRR
ncbi:MULTISPECIES: hypothetical protein [unclassified Brevundimonas]|uniref:hypothetical protein n=1 Tax=unclassified Brevundimonas TaxID=2622653 RepID=UPI0025BDFB14|nr:MULTISPECIES: hypothetical protein [unclassified Brevundimonas]